MRARLMHGNEQLIGVQRPVNHFNGLSLEQQLFSELSSLPCWVHLHLRYIALISQLEVGRAPAVLAHVLIMPGISGIAPANLLEHQTIGDHVFEVVACADHLARILAGDDALGAADELEVGLEHLATAAVHDLSVTRLVATQALDHLDLGVEVEATRVVVPVSLVGVALSHADDTGWWRVGTGGRWSLVTGVVASLSFQ